MGLNSGDGYGNGYGYGDGAGGGYGKGYGYGDGDGDGAGGNGDGYGYGYSKLLIPTSAPWTAYHYLKRTPEGLRLRSGEAVALGQALHEETIAMCSCGLHASLSAKDAKQYAPTNSVLTKVHVWGTVICGKDKLVATDRKIIEIIE